MKNMNDFLDSLLYSYNFNRIPYEKYKNIIYHYKDIFNESNTMPKHMVNIVDEIYTLPFDLSKDYTYDLNLNISYLYYIFNTVPDIYNYKSKDYNNNYETTISCGKRDYFEMKFNPDFLKQFLDETQIDKDYISNTVNQPNKTIICADFTGISPNKLPYFIIDGNHRTYRLLNAGAKSIKGILISRNLWIDSLLSQRDEIFVKILSNLNVLLRYNTMNINNLNDFMYNI